MQKAVGVLEDRVGDAQKAVDDARERSSALQFQRVTQSTRIANAAAALAAVRAQQSNRTSRSADAPPASLAPSGASPQPVVSATYAAARACLNRRPSGSPDQCHPSGHASAVNNRPAAPGVTGALIQTKRCPCVLRAPLYQPPRQIAAFRGTAGISYEDLHAAADPAARLVDFSQHALADLAERVCARKAAQLQLPSADVCWFVQTMYEAAAGVPLSVSATLSSPECMASFVLHGLISRIELMLMTAAASHQAGGTVQATAASQDSRCRASAACAVAVEEPPPTKAARAQPPPASAPPRPPHGNVVNTAPPSDTASDASASTPGESQQARRASLAAAAHSMREAGSPGWAGCVRVGIGEVHDARAAVHAALRQLLRRFCRVLPLPVLCRLLATSHETLTQMQSDLSAARWQAGGAAVPPANSGRSNLEVQQFMARIMAAGRGTVQLTVEALDAAANMQLLRRLEAEGPPLARHGHSPEQNLEEYSHSTLAAFALLHRLTLVGAPRTVANVQFYSVLACNTLTVDGEADSFHVHLYRQLQLTEDDRRRLIAHFSMWKQLSTALDAPFRAALAALGRLPQPADIPPALVARITAAAAAKGPRLTALMHEPHASAQPGVDEGDSSSVLRMLGASAQAAAEAERGLTELREVHEAHGRMRRETKELQMQPGVLLRPLQAARVWSAHLCSRVGKADMMRLCQLAAAQQRWRDFASRAHLPASPSHLPRHQWFVDATGDGAAGGVLGGSAVLWQGGPGVTN